jgi:acetylornithine deacetylase/succinyl-diaminopimelate desuccinylase-like protein
VPEKILDFIESCRRFIEIDSTGSNGSLEIAQFAAELCRAEGLFVELQTETQDGVDQANVIARPTEARPPQELLLQTHLDTAEPGSYALWTKTGSNPFNASIYQDTLYGLGAAHSKLDFLCKLKAVSALKGANWKLPFVLVGTFGEERGMQGAIKLIRKKKVSSRLALVGEPTALRLVHAAKGFASVEIEIPFSDEEKAFREQHNLSAGMTTQSRIFIGKAAHSSVPHLGESAISKMLQYLIKLPDGIAIMEIEGGISYNSIPAHAVLEIDMVGALKETIAWKISQIFRTISAVEKKFENYADSEFFPSTPTMNIGLIRTHEDYIRIGGCVRVPPTVSQDIYEQWMEQLKVTCHEVGADFRVTEYKQPFRTPPDSALMKTCTEELARIGLPAHCGTQPSTNEANVFSRFGIECVIVGPGQGVGNSHAPNEYVSIKELESATRFYQGVLERVCL